jgi:integrase
MKKNPNHPRKGSIITVDPIRNPDDIQAISRMLKDSPRDRLLFLLGINNGLRAGDLLKLKVRDVQEMKPGDSIRVREGKTGKINELFINRTVHRALRDYLDTVQPSPNHYLFKSKKGRNRPITIQAVNNLIKKWTRAINLGGNYGAHTLRKTFGYIQRTAHGVDIELLCRRFNHSSPRTTMRYIGVERREVQAIMLNEIG